MERLARFELAIEALNAHGRLAVGELADRFGVSEMTVRRDLEELERQGLCRRVHGGAVPAMSRSYEPPFAVRERLAGAAKAKIAVGLVDQLNGGETVLLDVGTTTLAVARALRGRSNLTVLTASLPIATLLADEPGLRVICLGGVVRRGEHSLVGSLTQGAIQQFVVDVCVLGVGGLDAEVGVTEFNLEDAAVKRTVLERSQRLIVVADRSKLGTVAFAVVAPATRIDILVTDAGPDDEHVGALSDLGVNVHSV